MRALLQLRRSERFLRRVDAAIAKYKTTIQALGDEVGFFFLPFPFHILILISCCLSYRIRMFSLALFYLRLFVFIYFCTLILFSLTGC